MARQECTIYDFRDAVATAADILKMEKKYFNLITTISGDPSILDNYKLDIYDGKKWISTYEGPDLCMLIILIRDMIEIEKTKNKTKG